MPKIQDISLKNKIILINTLVVLMMLAGAIGGIAFIIKNYNEIIYKTTFDNLRLSTVGIDEAIEKVETLSEYIVTDDTVQQELSNIQEREYLRHNNESRTILTNSIYKYSSFSPYITSISLLDSKGQQMSSSFEYFLADDTVDEIGQLALWYQGRQTWYIPSQTAGNAGSIICTREVRKIKDLELNHLGTVMIRLDLDRLVRNNLMQVLDERGFESGKMYIFHEGQVIYPLGEQSEIKMEELDREQGYQIKTIDQTKYLMTYNKLRGLDLMYAILIPYDKVYAARQSSNRILMVIGAMVVIITTMISITLIDNINSHFRHLVKCMKDFKGDTKLDEKEYEKYRSRKDEIGFLHQNFYEMAQNINELVNEGYKKQILIQESQISHLVSQINPHFLYNTLNSINWIAKMNKQQQISQIVEALATLMRTAISDRSDFITLRKELEVVRGYTFIQGVRYGERLDFTIEVEETLLDCQIPKLCIQPLVENSINYVLEDSVETCHIKVSAICNEAGMIITVEDNGPGVDPDILHKLHTGEIKPKHTGIGLSNIQRRVELLYGESYGLSFMKEETVARVNIHIPIWGNEEESYVKCHIGG